MNLGRTQQRIRWLALGILFASAVVLTVLDATGTLDPVIGFIRDPLTVITGWTSERTVAVEEALSGPRDIQSAQAEIARLESELAALQRENEELRAMEGELNLLQQMFDRAADTPEYRRITADIVGLDTSPSVRSIIIDQGFDDGVRVGMPVEAAGGLVGQVYRVSNGASQVVLLTETASAIPVRLGDTRATGILRGAGRGALPTIDWIDLRHQIEVDETVTTSGLGGKFPRNLVVGRVVDVERNEAELFQRAVVQPSVDFESLEKVFVITDFEQLDTDIFAEEP